LASSEFREEFVLGSLLAFFDISGDEATYVFA
jgi:hypothetical protein